MKQKCKNPRLWLLAGALAVLLAGVWLLAWLLTPKGDDLLLQVLDSRAAFVDETGLSVRLNEYTPLSDGAAIAPDRYAMLDLDGDGQQEMVAYYPQGNGTYLVFRIYEDRVYGYTFPESDFQNLKADGTFLQEKNNYTYTCCRLQFRETGYELAESAYLDRAKETARVGGKEVSAKEGALAMLEFWQKTPASWTNGPDAVDPMSLYESFLAGNATASDNWQPQSLSYYLSTDKAYDYAYFDMSGDGRPELCVQSGKGLHIFTVREKALRLWYEGETASTKLMENGMVLDVSRDYDLSYAYYCYWGLCERGKNFVQMFFSWSDSKNTYEDSYFAIDREVTREEYEAQSKPFFSLKEMPPKTGAEAEPPSNYDNLLLQVLKGEKEYQNEAGQLVLFQAQNDVDAPLGAVISTRYALVDMDGDGTNELVAFTLPGGTLGNYTVFHVHRGDVYGFELAGTEMQSLKTDGTFTKIDKDGNVSYLSMTFEEGRCQIHEQAYGSVGAAYRLKGKYAAWEVFSAYHTAFTLKPEAHWQTLPPTAVNNTLALYEAFLAGEIKAKDPSGQEVAFGTYLTADSGTFTYTLWDMTGDGTPELLIKMTYNLRIFTVKEGKVWLWSTVDARRYTLLNNGAFLYERHGAAPAHTDYEYRELDENGQVKRKITFSYYDSTTVDGVVHPARYLINNQEVTKEEYETQVLPYLQIGSDQITWYPTREQELKAFRQVLESKLPFITSNGESWLLCDYKLGGAVQPNPRKYALVDLDRDGAEELVCYTGSEYGAYLVFDIYHELVYGFVFSERALMELKADGTFMSSGGAGVGGCYKIAFAPNGFDGCTLTTQELAFWNETEQLYRLDGKTATADRVSAFREEFARMEPVAWLDHF